MYESLSRRELRNSAREGYLYWLDGLTLFSLTFVAQVVGSAQQSARDEISRLRCERVGKRQAVDTTCPR